VLRCETDCAQNGSLAHDASGMGEEGSNGENVEDVEVESDVSGRARNYQGRRRRLDDDDSDYSSSEGESGHEGSRQFSGQDGSGQGDYDSDDEPIQAPKAARSAEPGSVGRLRGRIPVRAKSTDSKELCRAVACLPCSCLFAVQLLEYVAGMLTVVVLVRSEVRRESTRVHQRKKKKIMKRKRKRKRKRRRRRRMGFRNLRGRWFQGHGVMWRFFTCLMGSVM
jgi:hypothetical protein